MKRTILFLLLTVCLSLVACTSDENNNVPKQTEQASNSEVTEEATTNHQHEWTYMENDAQSWMECEECGARKDIQDKATEVTTEAVEATTQATTQKKEETESTEKKKKNTKKRDDYNTDHDYNWYMRNGEGGEKFSYTMKVIQKVEEGIYLCDLGSDYSGDMVFIYVDTDDFTKEVTGGKKIIEDDVIRVYGDFVKTYIYETAAGGSAEALVVNAVYVDIQ